MRMIDADRLKAVLENIQVHVERDKASMAATLPTFLEYAMEIVDMQPTVASPPNAPLTPEELREMDGEPVWVERECGGQYRIITNCDRYFTNFEDGRYLANNKYGETWRAYRRKPEEGTANA